MRAWLNLRHTVPERRFAFISGLERCGFKVVEGFPDVVGPQDIFVTWNRIGVAERFAQMFVRNDRPVLVAENAAWGNDFAGERWYSIAKTFHNTAKRFPVGGPERFDSLGVDLKPWREGGKEIVILPQRGIGSPPTAMPIGWAEWMQKQAGGRIRPHPGQRPCVALEDDLRNARCVHTWGSGAAIKALLWGIPVYSAMPGWIGWQDNTDAGRLEMFRQLAWAQNTLTEIASGEPFRRLLA